ncbi:MAG: RhuM family protein [Rikenellaceae bacterium]
MESNIVIYQAVDGTTAIDVKFENETVWLTQAQMAELFQKDRSVITRHINNIFKEDESERESNVHFLHIANSDRPIGYYSLDVIISVGYRVKSKRGTQFRIWANRVLKEYLLKGYSIKDNIKLQQFEELKNTIKILSGILDTRELEQCEATGMLQVVDDYTYALDTLTKCYEPLQMEEFGDEPYLHRVSRCGVGGGFVG